MRLWFAVTSVILLIFIAADLGSSMHVLQESRQGPPTAAPTVPEDYAFLNTFGLARVEAWSAAQKAFPFASISISRRGCFGTCPVYTATLRSDDVATFVGGRNSERTGNFSGKVYFGDFARLALFVQQSGFMQYQERYTAPWTDDETVVVTVTMRDGTTKAVNHYGRYGPPNLWILEQAIDAIVDAIEWRSAS